MSFHKVAATEDLPKGFYSYPLRGGFVQNEKYQCKTFQKGFLKTYPEFEGILLVWTWREVSMDLCFPTERPGVRWGKVFYVDAVSVAVGIRWAAQLAACK